MWTKIKELLKKFGLWFLKTGWQIANVLALFVIYGLNKDNLGVEVIAGLWIFSLLAMYGWKWFTKKK